MMMMIIIWSLIFIIQSLIIDCDECNYRIIKSNNQSDQCVGNQCYQFEDISSLIVEPKTCKTSFLSLSFSSYEHFVLFRQRLQWKLGDLFVRKQPTNEIRQLILYLNELEYSARPFDHEQLIELGIHIDLFSIWIRQIHNKNYLLRLRHYHPQWNIIQVKFRCRQFTAFDRDPCSSEILSPRLSNHPQTIEVLISSTISMSLLSTEESSSIEKNQSIDYFLIIILPLIILLFIIFICILFYKCYWSKYSLKTNPMIITSKSSLNDHERTQRISSSSSSHHSIIPTENTLNIDSISNSLQYHHHRRPTPPLNNTNTNYEPVMLDNISIIGRQQRFVPIAFPNRF